MDDNSKVSIVIPVYNAEKYLPKCLSSVAAQAYRDFECILVDDGSADTSGRICDEFAKNDSRFRVFHIPNGGASNARNHGLDRAVGSFVTFVDSDDAVAPDFLSRAVDAIGAADLFVAGIAMLGPDGEQVYRADYKGAVGRDRFLETIERGMPQICFCGPWGKLYKHALIAENGIRFNRQLICGEDTDFNLRYIVCCKNVYVDDRVGYYYDRSNTNSLFSSFSRRHYEDVKYVYGEWVDVVNGSNVSEEYKAYFLNKQYADQLIGMLHYVFRGTRDRQTRKEIVKKLCDDPLLPQCSYRYISFRKKPILFLLKHKMCHLIMFIFMLRYYH